MSITFEIVKFKKPTKDDMSITNNLIIPKNA